MSKGFAIRSLKLRNFRNHKKLDLTSFSSSNILVGNNAVGKTNILEAIQLVTQLTSFRSSHSEELLRHNSLESDFLVEAKIEDFDTNTNLILSFRLDNKTKKYFFNSKNKKIKELKGKFPSVVFTPDDLQIVKGSNTMRRSSIDNLGCQISKDYYNVFKDYSRVLKQKNSLLKNEVSNDLLKSINDVLTFTGAQLLFYRLSLCNKISPILNKYYKQFSNEDSRLAIRYFPSWAMDDVLENISRDDARSIISKNLEKLTTEEKIKKSSIIGPHRDRIVFYLNDSDTQVFASQGQQRSVALALRFSEVEIIKNTLNKKLIILLDDVLSELDSYRRNMLLKNLKEQSQVFLTTTDPIELNDSSQINISKI